MGSHVFKRRYISFTMFHLLCYNLLQQFVDFFSLCVENCEYGDSGVVSPFHSGGGVYSPSGPVRDPCPQNVGGGGQDWTPCEPPPPSLPSFSCLFFTFFSRFIHFLPLTFSFLVRFYSCFLSLCLFSLLVSFFLLFFLFILSSSLCFSLF